ncbi:MULTISPECIES: fimbrial protein [unclassified Pseudomonas]|uniref:fimbrial protein n=1 Tax=unclassified Pseudomonas TaxID=196821 RepID=UPI0014763E36|nr:MULTISPECIES: fimbrial protein [unclassified Pseudomonas]MBX7278564.1 type 1 fimbrial protein [Pseudomonas sp. ERGC3:01]NMX94013.1 type 1 fimbrial protein [Pseudomonas sp. WS 5086]NMY48941.1 type 1 fimbrial protein [Pseudomonas sp. WS 5027]QZC95982.1 type 1 fimbrial protein [Pseudomonas sp. ERGC3:05]
MKFHKAPLAIFTALIVSSATVYAAPAPSAGSGKVHFEGSIIDAPCSLDSKSVDQTVIMDQVSNKALADNGTSEVKNFNIELRQCDISTLKKVKVTFGGDADANDSSLLGIAGSAKGAGIVLTNGSGVQVKLGEASTARTLLQGDNTLVFGAYLKGTTAKDEAVTPGSFNATANFMLAYE